MNLPRATQRLLGCLALAIAPVASAEEAGDDQAIVPAAIANAILDYNKRLEDATKALAQARVTVANERTPLMDDVREAEQKIAQLQADIARLTIEKARAGERTLELRNEQVALDRNLSYVANIVLDGFKAYENNLLAGEAALSGERSRELRQAIETTQHPQDALAALDAAEMFLARLQQQLGGYTVAGRSLRDGDNLLIEGTFAYLGPEVFFRATDGSLHGVVRERNDSPYVVTHALNDWNAGQAQALMRGEPATVPLDPSGGKALQLRETHGGLWAEMQKGGIVGYVIMVLGLVAITITVMKLLDLRQLSVDDPLTMAEVTGAIARGDRAAAQAAVTQLKSTTRELYSTGLRYLDAPSTVLEEQFEAFVLRHRLLQERRLPLLAVIATASPLLGLLGTVTGMIKTFTLITVFGTGSATRLSSGISEALVATALGLAVAIPTLVIHGFLAHRIHKGLALLERYALEFATAAEEARSRPAAAPSSSTLSRV